MTQRQNKKETDRNNWLSWWHYWRKNYFQNLRTEDIHIEDDLFNSKDPADIIDTSKDIIVDIKASDPFLNFSVPTSAIIDNLFDPAAESGDIIDTSKDRIGNIQFFILVYRH